MDIDAQPVAPLLMELELQEVVEAVSEIAAQFGARIYLVGGVVRDLLLGHASRDLDWVSETPAKTLGVALHKRLGGTLTCHETFLTCTLTLPTLTLDLATARTEVYTRPGALPKVTPGAIQADLTRRDFSVNTFALDLAEPTTLLSVPGAVNDLERRALRILHERSFFDDPTRIVRGARLAGRLGFRYDDEAETALKEALAAEVYRQVSPSRLKNELLITLAETQVAPALTYLSASGALSELYGLKDTPLVGRLDALKAELKVPVPLESYLLALLLGIPEGEAEAFVSTFSLPKKLLAARRRLGAGGLKAGGAAVTPAEKTVAQAAGPSSAGTDYPQVSGSDVLSLGLSAGPEVGRVLSLLAQARLDARVASFADELALAKRLVDDIS